MLSVTGRIVSYGWIVRLYGKIGVVVSHGSVDSVPRYRRMVAKIHTIPIPNST
jgi:hypothetical protein